MFYFLLGIAFILIQMLTHKLLVKMDKSIKLWISYAMILVANLSVIFSIAWAYESILETEIQAAMMGLLFFGGPGIILAIMTYRINKPVSK